MRKVLPFVLWSAALLVCIFFAVSLYRISQNTAANAGKSFIKALASNDKKQIAAMSSNALSQWPGQIPSAESALKGYTGDIGPTSTESINDQFHTYPANSDPTRLTYILHPGGKGYHIVLVMYKQQGAWIISGFTASYVQ